MTFYIYLLFRPWDGSPCYVGKGKGSRWMLRRARKNHRLLNIFAKAERLGIEVPAVKIRENLTETEAFMIERAFIAAIGRRPHGTLVNLTDGGEGVSGHVHSAESRAKMSLAAKGRPGPHTGRKLSAEHRAALSVAKLGKKRGKRPPEHGAAISAGKMGKKATEETRAALRAANRSGEPEVRERIRRGHQTRLFRKLWESAPVFVSPASQWGDGASAGLL